ncbi:MAG: hypothetical protein ABW022_09215 [Actinoplanes sp.]
MDHAVALDGERLPPAHAEQAHSLEELDTECSLNYEGWTTRSSRRRRAPR